MNAGKIAFWTIAGLVVAGGAYWAYNSLGGGMSKEDALQYLSNTKGWSTDQSKFYSTTDTGYLVEWAKAVKGGSGAFSFNGKKYDSQTGRAQ
jgi:hypothetical protein